MGILDRLKKEKKDKSVLDSLIEKKEEKAAEKAIPEKPSDIEVREMPATDPLASMDDYTGDDLPEGSGEAKPSREFRTEGMHEFTLDSLGAGAGSSTTLKLEYKSKILQAIDKGQIDEAIKLLEELKLKLLVEE